MEKITDELTAMSRTHTCSKKATLSGVTYNELYYVFGEPTFKEGDFSDCKVNYEWVFDFEGEVFTIYDWKTYSPEFSRDELVIWSIGGKSYAGNFVDEVYYRVQTFRNRLYDFHNLI